MASIFPGAGLKSLTELGRYSLSPSSTEIIGRARELARENGDGRLTTSLLLFAMVELGASRPGGDVLAFLYEHTLGSDPEAYRGVTQAYLGWYRRSCAFSGDAGFERGFVTPYVAQSLALAEGLAASEGADTPIDSDHIAAALLTYQPGPCQVQPGIQYILSMMREGVKPEDFVALLARFLGRATRVSRQGAASRHWWSRLLENVAPKLRHCGSP